ncbi:ROK family transcriptional regulator [Commensalibacter oyaizuii]|uniref:ROK family transcriptional regulator n=1 Tax=Commensalibacter oyaizuii TaxID=3043873 RepID=A0ABT6PZP2_9PROT|nr:ROK family transcriptional regulator [Commensalibacter sp. TBRC 16381]MDI2090327.1 ROK family transcriptional regulator [Commensalibacter sp. TBRC 16381]
MDDLSLQFNASRRIRHSNELIALQALHRFGALSRAEIARKMGLNRSSSGHIIVDLINNGFVREITRSGDQTAETYQRGRPGILLELIPEAAYFLGIEIGVEYITIILIDMTATVVDIKHQSLDCKMQDVEMTIDQSIKMALSMCHNIMMDNLYGIGFSVPGQMNDKGYIYNASLLRWKNIDFLKIVESKLPLDLPVAVENDANAFAIGALYQSNITQGVILFLVLESGIGGGLVVDGKLFRGGNGLASEIGHLIIQNEEKEKKSLESIIGLEELLSRYRVLSGCSEVTIGSFIECVNNREPIAVNLADEWAKYLGLALVQACRIVDPNKIILGGAMAELYSLVSARVNFYIELHQDMPFPIPEIILNKNPESGSAYGAACILHQRFLS